MTFSRLTKTIAASTAVLTMAFGGVAAAAPAHPDNTPRTAYRVKTLHKVGKNWSVETTSILKNANAACRKADPLFYSPPKKGFVYVVVQYTGKKLTDGKRQNLGDGIITNLYAKNGKQYGQVYGIVAPHDASSSKAVGKNQRTSGGFTYEVRISDVRAGHLEAIVEGTATSDNTPYFFAT